MVRKINPGLKRLWRDPSTLQFGYQPGYVLKDLSASEERIIRLLEIGVPDNQIESLPELAKSSKSEVDSILTRLSPILISGGTKLKFSAEEIEQKFSELIRIALVSGKNPDLVMRERSKSKVFISELSRAGLVITQALAACGIGRIFTADAKHVNLSDTQLLGYPEASLGVTRASSAKQATRGQAKVELHSRLSDPIYEETNFAILLQQEVVSPQSYQIWLSRDVPHIAVTFNERGVRISPVVVPGVSACLGCAEIEKIAIDPSWLAIAPQLAENPRNLADTQSLLFAAAVATRAAVATCDEPNPNSHSQTNQGFELNLQTGEISGFRHSTKNCGCRID
ncbi:MAG: hypothetical protein RIS51_735 [Actinomycetota bacterium]